MNQGRIESVIDQADGSMSLGKIIPFLLAIIQKVSSRTKEETLRQAFEAFGQVSFARIVKDKYSGQPRGSVFLEMPDQARTQAAIENLNGKELLGR